MCNIESASGGKLRVVVVDDDQAVRESLKFALELEGLIVKTHASGQALLDDALSADCLVLDYKMPAMDGLAVLAALFARGSHIPAILITAPVTAKVRDAAGRAGVFSVLEKPLADNVLLQNIRCATRS